MTEPPTLDPLNPPDYSDRYDGYLRYASDGKFTDFLKFHEFIMQLLLIIDDALSKVIDNPNKPHIKQGGLFEECANLITIYNNVFDMYPNTPLKALIIHDLKGIMYNIKLSFGFKEINKPEDAEFMLPMVRSLTSFIYLIKIVLYHPGELISDFEIAGMLHNTLDRRLNMELNFQANYLTDYRVLIWPIHTILLNAMEKKANSVLFSIFETEDQIVVEISDDIADFEGVTGDELIETINYRINSPPKRVGRENIYIGKVTNMIIAGLLEDLADDADSLDHLLNRIIPLVTDHTKTLLTSLRKTLPANYARAVSRMKVGDTDQLAAQSGLSITKTFMSLFNGQVYCSQFDQSRYNGNPNKYVKTITMTLPKLVN